MEADLVAADGNTLEHYPSAQQDPLRSASGPAQRIQEQVTSRGTGRQVGPQGSKVSIRRPGYRVLCLLKGNKTRDDWSYISGMKAG